ncbi:unnamed protein product [Rotaria sp. Silwood1]|nr:unnamed protein product [Rotaria sp. Silwood1]CAF1431153.1 unnamed protein product [Rotaria sp. Silwood1]CAF3588045.1 unnamed protein product [Rotaria sp. Silwood1]CAF4564623.1 unnamed protein product [Rotaria sp. Silwood1]
MFIFRYSTALIKTLHRSFNSTAKEVFSVLSGSCCVDSGAKQSHDAKGHEETLAGIATYKTGRGQSTIIIFTDIFGFSFINIRKIADTYAQGLQTTVIVPDMFNGDSMNPKEPNLFDKLPAWLNKHPSTDACSVADKIISTIKGHYDSIQVVGFCYGGKIVIHLITHPELSSSVKAAVVAHPSFLVKEEAKQIKRPILFQCAEIDERFTPDIREHFQKELTQSGLGKFIDYPGTSHGFVVRPDGSQQVEKQKNKAIADAIEYLKKNF